MPRKGLRLRVRYPRRFLRMGLRHQSNAFGPFDVHFVWVKLGMGWEI